MRNRKASPVLITDAPEDPERELRHREIRYLIMMSIRALCLILAAILVKIHPPLLGLWLILCVIGTVLLPWLAVILANDRMPKKRAARPSEQSDNRAAISPLRADQIYDPDAAPGTDDPRNN